MKQNLQKYTELSKSPLSKFTKALDPLFSSYLLRDEEFLRKYVVIPTTCSSFSSKNITTTSIRDELENENSLHGLFDDEVTWFLRATAHGDKNVDPLDCWRLNENSFPSKAKLARDVRDILA